MPSQLAAAKNAYHIDTGILKELIDLEKYCGVCMANHQIR